MPLLGSAVTLLVIGAILFVFYPAFEQWRARDSIAVVGHPPAPGETVPVWVCREVEGVALILEAGPEPSTMEALAGALEGGPYQFLRLSVLNFAQEAPYTLALPDAGLASPEGGPTALPAHALVKEAASPRQRLILRGLGALERIEVAKGKSGHLLLVVGGELSGRTAFVSGNLSFTRRVIERGTLAAWRASPDLRQFKDF